MSISDRIVVMNGGVVQQVGKPQKVYDDPDNLFVAKFLGTPPISVFSGRIAGEKLYIGDENVMDAAGLPDQAVTVGIRPEGFEPCADGALCCKMHAVEVMGRDVSVVCEHPACENREIRAIVRAESAADENCETVRFRLRPEKVCLFRPEDGARIRL